MVLDDGKKANVNVPVTLLLMLCIVMFISSLYYLVINGPWTVETRYKSVPISQLDASSSTIEEPSSIDDALQYFVDTSCTIVVYNFDTNKYKITEISFEELYNSALSCHVLFMIEIEEKPTLAVIEKGYILAWTP